MNSFLKNNQIGGIYLKDFNITNMTFCFMSDSYDFNYDEYELFFDEYDNDIIQSNILKRIDKIKDINALLFDNKTLLSIMYGFYNNGIKINRDVITKILQREGVPCSRGSIENIDKMLRPYDKLENLSTLSTLSTLLKNNIEKYRKK